jgi:hypothetical protein
MAVPEQCSKSSDYCYLDKVKMSVNVISMGRGTILGLATLEMQKQFTNGQFGLLTDKKRFVFSTSLTSSV